MESSDAKLVERCIEKDARAWETLVHAYSGRILNMAYQYTGRRDVAEELTQDVFLRIFQNLNSFRPDSGPLRNWIMRVGRNLIIDHYRATRQEKNVAGSQELETLDFKQDTRVSDPFENLYVSEKSAFVMEGLQELTAELKEAVVLRDLQGLSYQEIAKMLDIPEGTVKSRINRGRIELAKTLKRKRQAQEEIS